jgi:hypothetical protein
MLELTEQQQQAVDASPEPPRLLDPRTNKTYVLIEAEAYERIKDLLAEDDLTMQQVAVLVERALQDEDAGDPTLEFYQQKYGTNSNSDK